MPGITRTFPLEQLKDWDVPHADNTEIQTTDEWCVFRAPDDGLIYRFYFSPVFADYAEMDWYDDMPATVSCDRVEKRTRTVAIDEWVPVVDAAAEAVDEAAAIDPDVAVLRRAAAQARAEGQDAEGPSRAAILNFASMLENEADKVESGDRGTLPPVLASARVWLTEAVDAR